MLRLRDLRRADAEHPASDAPAVAHPMHSSSALRHERTGSADDGRAEWIAAREPVDERGERAEDEPLVRLPEHLRPQRGSAGEHSLDVRERAVEDGGDNARAAAMIDQSRPIFTPRSYRTVRCTGERRQQTAPWTQQPVALRGEWPCHSERSAEGAESRNPRRPGRGALYRARQGFLDCGASRPPLGMTAREVNGRGDHFGVTQNALVTQQWRRNQPTACPRVGQLYRERERDLAVRRVVEDHGRARRSARRHERVEGLDRATHSLDHPPHHPHRTLRGKPDRRLNRST